MAKFLVQMTVSVEVAKMVNADSLEHALEIGRELANECPVRAGIIRIPARVEYQWNNETQVTGALKA